MDFLGEDMVFLAAEPDDHRCRQKKAQTMRSGPVNPPFEEVEETTSAKIRRVVKDCVLMRWVQYIGADAAPHHES
jgi:hypothetical protein